MRVSTNVKPGKKKSKVDDDPAVKKEKEVNYKGPTYLKQNPKSTAVQNEMRAKENINRALEFKRNLSGPEGVSTQYLPRETQATAKFKKDSNDIGVLRVDKAAVQKADSVLATRKMVVKTGKKKR